MDKQIANLKKQNEGMETAFKNKNIEFTKLSTDNIDPEIELDLLKNYNEYLKGISKNNRPPPQEKQVKQEQKQQSVPKKKEEDDDDQGDDDVPKDLKPIYSTIVNMEDIKRAFFNKEYDNFNDLIRQHPFKYYQVNYKYASDNTGRPQYVAKNLLRGFVQGLDDYRKYFIVCFRCILTNKEINEYIYPSYWIVNSNDDIKTILGSLHDDYEFNLVEEPAEITRLLKKMEKTETEEDDTLVGEIYLH
jgi:hypothetical protein